MRAVLLLALTTCLAGRPAAAQAIDSARVAPKAIDSTALPTRVRTESYLGGAARGAKYGALVSLGWIAFAVLIPKDSPGMDLSPGEVGLAIGAVSALGSLTGAIIGLAFPTREWETVPAVTTRALRPSSPSVELSMRF